MKLVIIANRIPLIARGMEPLTFEIHNYKGRHWTIVCQILHTLSKKCIRDSKYISWKL